MEHISLGIINILKKGADQGYWTVDQIDRPSHGWAATTKVDRRFFKKGYQGIEHRNLLRESGYAPQPEPGVELDGVTTYTNDNPIPPELPF
jgi:hypothetical protein